MVLVNWRFYRKEIVSIRGEVMEGDGRRWNVGGGCGWLWKAAEGYRMLGKAIESIGDS